MSEIVLRIAAAGGKELTFDDADVIMVESPIDMENISCDEAGCQGCEALHRRLTGRAHLKLDFTDGKWPLWREAADEDPQLEG